VSATVAETKIETPPPGDVAAMVPADEGLAKPPVNAKSENGKAAENGKAGKASKDSKAGKGAKRGARNAEPDDASAPSVAGHPRAARAVARARSWGGLSGFLLTGYLSLSTGTIAGACLRALVAGIVCYVVVWAAAVFLWRRLVVLEMKAREQALHAPAGRQDSSAEVPERTRARARTAS
jgi:predicted lipid-binding transport protein (Tim44 family)